MKTRSWKKRSVQGILLVIAVLIIIRLLMPFAILKYLNRSLDNMSGYRGHIEDVDLALIRGAYSIDDIYIHKVDSATGKETEFFSAATVDLSVEWKALFSGALVGELIFHKPTLVFTKDKTEPDEVRQDSSTFKLLLEDFMPLKVNRFEVREGNIRYVDEHSKPKVDVTLSNTHIVAHNLINSYDSGSLLPATIKARGSLYGGELTVDMKINPMADVPTFDLNAELVSTQLPRLNDFFSAYAKADVNAGTFGLYTEIAAKEGRFAGYVKPFFEGLKVVGKEDRNDNVLRKTWEGLVQGVTELLENQPNNRFATKIPFSGKITNPNANVWYAIAEVFQNAFIRALQPTLDAEIDLRTIDKTIKKEKNIIDKVFGSDRKKKGDRN